MIWKLFFITIIAALGTLVFILSKEVPAPSQEIHKSIDSKQFIKE